ncbi:MAG: VWA domain-containing protein [Candidatus Competibacteraceae bacterium]
MRNPLLGALPLLAQALGDKYGVTVDIGGQGAWTDGDTIHLPALPLDDDGTLWVLANGYLDHEAGHVRHTDFTVAKGATPLHQALSNLLEDIRVDARMGERYPGCLSNSQRLDAQLVAAGDYRIPAVDAHPAQVLQSYLLQRGRALLLGAEALTPLADQTEAVFRQVFPPGLATRLSAALYGARDLASTQAAVDLAAQLVALVQDAADSTPPGQTPGSAPASPPPTAADQTSASPGQAPADSGQNPTAPDQTPAGAGPTAPQQVLRQALNASEADLLPDRNRLVADRLAATATQSPQQNGRVAVARSGGHGKGTVRFGPPPDLAAVRRASVVLRARLAGLVQASRLCRSPPHRTGQRLDSRQLHRLAVRDPRLFQHRREQPAVNTAMLVLLDRSGSMEGTKIQVAREAVLATALALETIPGVQVATAAFPLDDKDVWPLTGFGQRVQVTLPRYGLTADGLTPLAEALWWVAWQLLRRREPRKLALIVSDGYPSDGPAAQTAITRLTAAGLELVGIGIQTNGVQELFPSGLTIQRLEDLAPALFTLLQERLRAG